MTGATGPRIPPAASAPPPASPAIVLRSSEFRRGREASWLALENILVRVEKRGLRALAAEDLEQLPLLYRALLSSLSVARSIALDRNMLLYLETLAVRGFIAVYGPRRGLIAGVGAFFRHDFLRDRSIVLERLERLGVHCLDVPSRGLAAGVINRYLRIKQRGLI